jgi:hypothetical protein
MPTNEKRGAGMAANIHETAKHSGDPEPRRRDVDARQFYELLRLAELRRHRLQRLIALDAPEIMLRAERRLLRATVDAVLESAVKVCLCAERPTRTDLRLPASRRNSPGSSRPQPPQPVQLYKEQIQ